MAALRLALCLVVLLAAPPAGAETVDRWNGEIAEASARFGVPADWIRRVIRAESGGRTMLGGRPITSSAGAMGLMQLMPGTWSAMRSAHGLGPNPYDPRDNILAGTAYLRAMYDRFGYPGLFAAYNAGPARYARHLATGRPLPPETLAYAAGLVGAAAGPRPAFARNDLEPSAPAPSASGLDSLFFRLERAAAGAATSTGASPSVPDPLFVTLTMAAPVPE